MQWSDAISSLSDRCTETPGRAGAIFSCANRCGDYQFKSIRGLLCQCDAYCKEMEDCCGDFDEFCAVPLATTRSVGERVCATQRRVRKDRVTAVGWNGMKSMQSFYRQKPLSHEVHSERVNERANEWEQRRARAKRVVRRERMRERCEWTEERMAQYCTRRFHSHLPTVHRCKRSQNFGWYLLMSIFDNRLGSICSRFRWFVKKILRQQNHWGIFWLLIKEGAFHSLPLDQT